MPHLRYRTFDGSTRTHDLKIGTTRIGRTPDNDLQIDELELSSHHCQLRYDGERIVLRDLQSVGGTYVDGQPVTETTITPGQVISMGTMLIHLEPSSSEPVSRTGTELKPVQLADGSYSCLRHHTKRALYECTNCFDLACEECARLAPKPDGSKEAFCNSCGGAMRYVDWSKLDMSQKDILKELLIPKKVKQAIEFWEKRKAVKTFHTPSNPDSPQSPS